MNKTFFILLLLGFLAIPSFAHAFFDDGRPYMALSQWEEITAWDLGDKTDLIDQGDKLAFTSDGWSADEDHFRGYASKWSFDLNEDFEFTIGFKYDHTGTAVNDKAEIGVGLVYIPLGWDQADLIDPTHDAEIAAENDMRGQFHDKNLNDFSTRFLTPDKSADTWWLRTITEGEFFVKYDAEDDDLQLGVNAIRGDWDSVVGRSAFQGLKGTEENPGIDKLNLIFFGDSNGAALDGQNSYLEGFELVKGVPNAVPEPISSTLFLLGGGALFLRRRLKREG